MFNPLSVTLQNKLLLHCLYSYCGVDSSKFFFKLLILLHCHSSSSLTTALIGAAVSLESCVTSFLVMLPDYVCLYDLCNSEKLQHPKIKFLILQQIQRMWRGYFIRKYTFNFYSRKRYLEGLMVKNEIIR